MYGKALKCLSYVTFFLKADVELFRRKEPFFLCLCMFSAEKVEYNVDEQYYITVLYKFFISLEMFE